MVRRLLAVVCLLALTSLAFAQDLYQTARVDDPQAVSSAAVPRLVRFSGTLGAAGAQFAQREEATGSVRSLTFALYADQAGGNALWSETQNVVVGADGKYSVMIGAATKGGMPVDVFATGAARWLQVSYETGLAQPRSLMVSVPYALKAEDAQTLNGKSLSDFVLSADLQQRVQQAIQQTQAERERTNTTQGLDGNGQMVFSDTSGFDVVLIAQNGPGTALEAFAVTGTAIKATSPGTSGSVIVADATGAGGSIGVTAQSIGTFGIGVYGRATNASGPGIGVKGESASPTGRGVLGTATTSSGSNIGVLGQTASNTGVGVQGSANNITGGTGVYGTAPSGPGIGVMGEVFNSSAVAGKFKTSVSSGKAIVGTGPSGDKFVVTGNGDVTATSLTLATGGSMSIPNGNFSTGTGTFSVNNGTQTVSATNNGAGNGVVGNVLGTSSNGVVGRALNTSSSGAGVRGETASDSNGTGVLGVATTTTGFAWGVRGVTFGPGGIGVEGSATGAASIGVNGTTSADDGIGILGMNTSVVANSSAVGIHGVVQNADGTGVFGISTDSSGAGNGVRGFTAGAGVGVLGDTGGSGNPWGVWGHSNSFAGIGGVFTNSSDAQALTVFNNSSGNSVFDVQGTGDVSISAADTSFSSGGFADFPSPRLILSSSIWSDEFSAPVLSSFIWRSDLQFVGDPSHNIPKLSLHYADDQDGDFGEILSINQDGTINFAPGQAFPGALTGSSAQSITTIDNFSPALSVVQGGTNNAATINNFGGGDGLFVSSASDFTRAFWAQANGSSAIGATIQNTDSLGTILQTFSGTEPRFDILAGGVRLYQEHFATSSGFGSIFLDMVGSSFDTSSLTGHFDYFRWQVRPDDGSPASSQLKLYFKQDVEPSPSDSPIVAIEPDGAFLFGGSDSNVTKIRRHYSKTGVSLALSGVTNGTCQDTAPVSLPGVQPGDTVSVGVTNMDTWNGWLVQGYVPLGVGGNAIVIRACRLGAAGGSITDTVNVTVFRE